MNCLIIAATAIEIQPFLQVINTQKLKKVSVDVHITGIGLTATTYSLLNQIRIKRPDLIIQAGVGGCFDKAMPLGAVVAIKKEAIADQSVVELGKLKTLFDLNLLPQNKFPYQKGWLVNNHSVLKKLKLKKVSGISVNEITTSTQKVKFYQQHFNPVIESMEGAALHYVCLMENIPFVQIRSISNYIAERNKKNWNMKQSIINLNSELANFIQHLNAKP